MQSTGADTKIYKQGEYEFLMRNIVDLDKQTLAGRRFDAQKLADLINEGYLKGRREPSDRAKKSFAPSGIGYGSGTCPRQWFYAFTGGIMREEDTDAMGIANMSYGTEAHARIQKVFADTGILIEEERKVVTDGQEGMPPIFGYADLIIKWQGEEVVGEIKTTGPESYVSKKAKSTGAGYHLLQILIYMKVLGLNKGFLLYENKATQQLLIVPVTWNVENKKLVDNAIDWMNKVYKNWQDGNKPVRPFKSERSVVCKTCPFTKHCWSDTDEGSVKLPVLDVPK